MADDLKQKLDKVKDDHAAELVQQQGRDIAERKYTETLFFLGRVKQIGHDARSIATALSAQEIRALEHFQEQRMYLTLGYSTFVDFLEKSEYSPMSKRQYYERRELMNAHGDEVYDLLTSVGISVRSAKLLGAGELSIKGDKLMIGEEEISTGDAPLVKQAIQELCDDRRNLQDELAKRNKTIDDQNAKIAAGQRDYEHLQRNLDALQSANPHDTALTRAAISLLELSEVVGGLPENIKASRGQDAIAILWTAIQRVKRSYGTNFNFTDAAPTAEAENDLDAIARQVFDESEEDLD